MDYCIVGSSDIAELDGRIQREFIPEGWEPQGGISGITWRDREDTQQFWWVQAMVRRRTVRALSIPGDLPVMVNSVPSHPHERYPMTYDQPAQIDCRVTSCIFYQGAGVCSNVSPAITLNADKHFVCWSEKDRDAPPDSQ